MHCPDFENQMHWVLDRREDPERDLELRTHAAECRVCRQLLVNQRNLFRQLAKRARRGASIPARESVCRADRLFHGQRPSAATWVTAITAAVLLLAGGLVPWLRPNADRSIDLRFARSELVVQAPSDSKPREALSDANLAAWQNVQRALLGITPPAETSERPFPFGLQPLTNSLQETFGGLRQLIPTTSEPSSDSARPEMTVFRADAKFA